MKYFNFPMSSSSFSSFQEYRKCESSFFADTCARRIPIFIGAVVNMNYNIVLKRTFVPKAKCLQLTLRK